MRTASCSAITEGKPMQKEPIFQPGDKGLNLVTKEGTRYLPNMKAEIA
jgi:hypothetical protein